MNSSAGTIGRGFLDLIHRWFSNRALNRLCNEIINNHAPNNLTDISFLELTPRKVKFKGTIRHPQHGYCDNTGEIVEEIPEAFLETGLFELYLPEGDIDAEYNFIYKPLENHMSALEVVHGPRLFSKYKALRDSFYAHLKPQEEHPDCFDGMVGKSDFGFRTTFNNDVIDELGTKRWVETGTYDSTPPPYTWGTVFEVRTFFDTLFTDLQRDWGAIWATQPPLDPALIASTREALDAYFAEGKDGSAEGDARVGMASMPAERDDAPAAGAGASAL